MDKACRRLDQGNHLQVSCPTPLKHTHCATPDSKTALRAWGGTVDAFLKGAREAVGVSLRGGGAQRMVSSVGKGTQWVCLRGGE